MADEGCFWDWSEELDLLRGFLAPSAPRFQQGTSELLPDKHCEGQEQTLENTIRVEDLPSEDPLSYEDDSHIRSSGTSLEDYCSDKQRSEFRQRGSSPRHPLKAGDQAGSLSATDPVDSVEVVAGKLEDRVRVVEVGIAESCVVVEDQIGDFPHSSGEGTLADESPSSDGLESKHCGGEREGSPCLSQCSATDCESSQLIDTGRDECDSCWANQSQLEDSDGEKQVAQESMTGRDTAAVNTLDNLLGNPLANHILNPASIGNPAAKLVYHSDTDASDSRSTTCSPSQPALSDSSPREETRSGGFSLSLPVNLLGDETRSGSFSLPSPVDLPLRLLGLVARPLLVLRHVPQVLTVLNPSPKTRRVRLGPGMSKDPLVRISPGEGVVSPLLLRQKRLDKLKRGRKKESHFARGHALLDLTCTDWLSKTDPPFSDYSHTGFDPPTVESPSQLIPVPIQLASTPPTLDLQTDQDHYNGGRDILVSKTDSVTDCGTLVASADASEATPPSKHSTESKAPHIEIIENTHLEIIERTRQAQNPTSETDSFSLEHSPSIMSLGGGFRYQDREGGVEQSPLSSRSTSSADLDGGEAQSDLDSGTELFDSHLYLPSNHLTFTPPESPAKAAPPLKPISEESRRFELPPGVTDPVEVERLEQEWAHRLRVRRAENGDQCYMSLAELTSPPWNDLVFWHGSDKKGQPVLHCKLGLAVRTLPRHMQERMGCALYSMVELAENHLWRPECGWGFQRMTTIVDAEGLGITRMAPVESLKHGFKLIHRDYPARQGFVYLVNVPPLLGVMIGVFKRVIGCDDRAANERLGVFGRNYRSRLQKDFEPGMLHVDYGGSCTCVVCERKRGTSNNGAAVSEKRFRRPEDWLSTIVSPS